MAFSYWTFRTGVYGDLMHKFRKIIGIIDFPYHIKRGWSDGAMLGKLSVSGRPSNFDKNRALAHCACNRCGWGLFGHFYPSTERFPKFSGDIAMSLASVRPSVSCPLFNLKTVWKILMMVMSMMVSFCAVLFSRDVLDEILNLIESVSEGFPAYSFIVM